MAFDFGIEEPQSDKARIAELERQLEEAEAAYTEWYGKNGDDGAPATWDDLQSQLRESQLAVVALREAIGGIMDWYGDATEPAIHAREVIANTSATAQQVRAEIEREALEGASERVSAMWIDGGFNALGYVRAAILGQKEKG